MIFLQRRPIAGIAIFTMIVITIVNGFFDLPWPMDPLILSGITGWIAVLLVYPETTRLLRIQVGIILFSGLLLIAYAFTSDFTINVTKLINSNAGLLSMIAAISFLRLIALPVADNQSDLPKGKSAFLHTILGLSLFSSFINISAPLIISDKIHEQRPLTPFTSQTITRVFCNMASWSPFFGAMAVVLSYTPGAKLIWIMAAGIPFAAAGLIVIYLEGVLRKPDEVENFVGFPMRLDALKIPFMLMACVLLGSILLSNTSVLVVITISALVVSITTLISRHGIEASIQQIGHFIVDGLPRMANELALFMSAGVLAVGIGSLINSGIVTNPFVEFNATTASLLLGAMTLMAFVGIHPVITISSVSALVLTLSPNPTLLAMTYLYLWHLGTCSCFLSGTHVIFQSRYGIPNWKAALWNWPYAIFMYVIAVIWLHLVEYWFLT